MKFILSTVALAAMAQATYPITGTTVNCRAGPSTDTAIVRTYKKDDQVTITCQTNGLVVNGNNIWDHTTDGCFVSDFFVKTGSSKFVAEKCPSTSASTTAAPATSSGESAVTTSEPTVSASSTAAPTGGNGNSTTTVAPTGSLPTGGAPTTTPPVTAGAVGLEMAAKGLYIALPVAFMAMF